MTAPAAGAWEANEHRLPVRVYYEDTDFTGVVFHGAYLNFCERGRTEALRLLGVGHTELKAADPPLAFAVVRIEVDYRRPASVDDALVVHTVFEGFRGAVMIVAQRVTRAGEPIAEARVHVVSIGLDGRPRRLPRLMVEILKQRVF